MINPKVSIIIRTKNEERWIGHCLKKIKSQSYQNREIILVDSGSTDQTVNKAKRYGIDNLVKIENYKPGYAINEGIKVSTGSLIVILSAHCIAVKNTWLCEMVEDLDDKNEEKIGALYGKQLPMEFSSDQDKRDLLIVFGEDPRIQKKDNFFHNANSIIRRELWEEFNFDNNANNLEDRLWAKKIQDAGYKIKYTPRAAVYHYHGIHQSGSQKRLDGVTKVLGSMETKNMPGIINPNDLEICLVIPIRGKPLNFGKRSQLEYAADSILSSKFVNNFFVTTDSHYTASMAKDLGFKVAKIRDKSLSSSSTSISDVQYWHLNILENEFGYHPDVITHAEITYPFRPPNLIDELISSLTLTDADTVLPAKVEFSWAWKNIDEDNSIRLDEGDVPRKYKKSLLLGSHGLGCVSYSEVLRRNSLVGEKVHLLPIKNQLSFIEVRTKEESEYYFSKISFNK